VAFLSDVYFRGFLKVAVFRIGLGSISRVRAGLFKKYIPAFCRAAF